MDLKVTRKPVRPVKSCLLGGKSPSVKLMSRRENKKKKGQNQPNSMDRTMQELQHIGSIKDLRSKNYKVQTFALAPQRARGMA